MSKRKKRGGGKVPDSPINLAAAILNLITAQLLNQEKLSGDEGEGNLPFQDTKTLARCQDGYFDL